TEDGLVEHAAILQGAAHDLGRNYWRAIVGKGNGSALDQATDLGQLLTLTSLRDGAHRKDVGIAGPSRLEINEFGGCLAVECRLGVGHTRHRSDAAGQG